MYVQIFSRSSSCCRRNSVRYTLPTENQVAKRHAQSVSLLPLALPFFLSGDWADPKSSGADLGDYRILNRMFRVVESSMSDLRFINTYLFRIGYTRINQHDHFDFYCSLRLDQLSLQTLKRVHSIFRGTFAAKNKQGLLIFSQGSFMYLRHTSFTY